MKPGHTLKTYVMRGSRDRWTISTLYLYLNDHHATAKSSAMLGWEAETGHQHPVEDWLNMHKCTRSVAIKETVVKLYTRWYYTPVKIHRMCPSIPDIYFRGCGYIVTYSYT